MKLVFKDGWLDNEMDMGLVNLDLDYEWIIG